MQGFVAVCAAILFAARFASAAVAYGAPDRVVPEPLRIGVILGTDAVPMINSLMLFVSNVNFHGGLRMPSPTSSELVPTLLQFVISEASDSVETMAGGNISFWLSLGQEVLPSPADGQLLVTTSRTTGLSNTLSLFNNDDAQILSLLVRTLHQKASKLLVLLESGYQGCENVSRIAAQWNLLVVIEALETLEIESLERQFPLLICAGRTSTVRFIRSAKSLDSMPQALLVTCPLSQLQSDLGADANFLIAFESQLPPATVELGAAARNHSQFVQAYQRRFLQTPSAAAILAYSSAQHLLQAVVGSTGTVDSVALELQRRGVAAAGEVVQQAPTQTISVSDLIFPAPSWAERACWASGGHGYASLECRRCNATEEVEVNWTTGRRQCVACASPCGCQGCQGRPCEAGASNETGTCVPCAPGRFATGSSSCLPCPPGFISPKPGAAKCDACAVGYYAPEAALRECLPCPRGHAANTTGRSSCSTCAPGTFGFMGLCQDCAVGSFQAMSGQSSCVEDSVGQRSGHAAVAPSNVPGFYAIWAASQDDAAQQTTFDMEPCVKEEACLAERCAKGSTGRQCFGVLGGFSAGMSSRYECASWQLYMAVGIVMTVFYLAAYTRFATVLATTDMTTSERSLYLMMLKMFLNHCASMSVLLSCFLRATSSSPLLETFMSLAMITDGVPPCANAFFSLPCLLQPWRTQELQQAFDALAAASQVEYFSSTLDAARVTLASFHRNVELRLLLFWALLPLAAPLLPTVLLLLWLRIYMARHSQHWHQAAEFSSKVHSDGLEAACSSYPPEALQEMLAISSRRLWGLSWPLMHCGSWVRSPSQHRSFLGSLGCCLLSPLLFFPRLFGQLDLLRFWSETAPLRIPFLYFLSFAAARRCFGAAAQCQRLGDAAVMYSNGILDCDVRQPLLYISLLTGFLWALWPFLCLFRLRRDRESIDKAALQRQYGIMLLGYNSSSWWWEVVVCSQKLIFIAVEVVPISAVQQCFVIVCVSLAQMLCHVTGDRPFDHRWHHFLNRLQMKHLFVLLCSAFLCMMSLQTWLLPLTVVIAMALLQGLYVLTLLISVAHLALLATDVSTVKLWEKAAPGCWKRWVKLLLSYKRRHSEAEPYIVYDNVHRYVSVLANTCGQCTLPHLPIGRQLEVAGQKAHAQVRCLLSDVPRHLQKFHFVSSAQQREASRELLLTVAALAQHSATMSSFLLDFVVRAAFLTAADQTRSPEEDAAQEVDKHAWQAANRKRDLLVIASLAEEQRQRDLQYGQATRGGPSLQQDLSREEEAIVAWGLEDGLEDAAEQRDSTVPGSSADPEPLVQQKVYRMFSPTIFRRGYTLQELKASLVQLRNTPQDELQQWLDFFERLWFLEFLDSDKEIHLMSGTRLERGVQAESLQIMKALKTRRARNRAEKDATADATREATEETNIKVYLKWVRFVLYHYCGGIQAVDLGDVMRTRLSRPSRFVIQTEMMALEADEEEHEAEEEAVIIGVDEEALQRVEHGLDSAIAMGLQLEPSHVALQRLERGVDRALSLDGISL